MKFKNYILIVSLLFSTLILSAQNNFEFEKLEGENVTTQSISYGIEQDSIGNLWIASEEGVMKYNSSIIKIYNTYNGLPETVNNRITAIYIDSNEKIWIGHASGICIYNDDLDKFELIESNIDINPSLINNIIEDKDGVIWIGGFNGLWRYNASIHKFERILEKQIQALFIAKEKLILGTPNGLFNYSKDSDILTEIETHAPENNIWFIGEVNNQIYTGTKTGEIFNVNLEFNTTKKLNLRKKITHPVTDILNDKLSNIYIAVDGEGLYYLNKDFKIIKM